MRVSGCEKQKTDFSGEYFEELMPVDGLCPAVDWNKLMMMKERNYIYYKRQLTYYSSYLYLYYEYIPHHFH